MEKDEIGTNFFIPMPVVLVGTVVSGRPNFMTVGWCTRANASPPMVLCGIGNHHYTRKGIDENQTFSVNIPSAKLLQKTDYCGIVSGEKTDKSAVFSVFYEKLSTAPLIRECPVVMECRLVRAVPLPANTVYIGEIVGCYADRDVLVDMRPDFDAIDPLFLTMPDNQYRNLGKVAGHAWKEGRSYRQE